MCSTSRALLAVGLLLLGCATPRAAGWSPAVVSQPTLDWQPRSDWVSVKATCGASGDGKAYLIPSKHAEEKYTHAMIIKFLEEQGLAKGPVHIQCDPESAVAAVRKQVLDKVKGAMPRTAPRTRMLRRAWWSALSRRSKA